MMKNKAAGLACILLLLSFRPDNDRALQELARQSPAIIMAKVAEKKRCARMEDGIEECVCRLKTIKVYKGKTILAGNEIETTVNSYACALAGRSMPEAGETFILYLSDAQKAAGNEPATFSLADDWLGIQHYTETLDKWLTEYTGNK